MAAGGGPGGGARPADRQGARRRARPPRGVRGVPHRGQGSRPVGRVVALAVAAAVLVVVGVAAAVLRGGDEGGGGGGPAVVAAEMRTGRGRVVGEVTLAGDRPVDVTVDVPE